MPPSPQTDVEFQRGIADTHNKKVFSILHDRFRVLSLVGSLFDLDAKEGESDEQVTLMWSHYADQFQGICLALDPLRFRNGIQLGGFAVKYPPERQRLPASYYDCYLALDAERSGVPGYPKDPESELLLPQAVLAERDRERFIELLTHKSPAWAYEREIRMIYEIAQQRKLPDYRRIEFPCETCKQRGFPAEKCEKPWYRDAIEVPPEAILAVIFATDCM